jgi:ribosome-binding factor A
MPSKKSSEPTQRMLRVGEELRHIISETLRRGGFTDPLLFEGAGNVTVTQVTVSPDLKYCTAYVMTLGGIHMDEILPALNNSAWQFQQDIGKGAKMRSTPKVRFVVDESFEQAGRIEKILKNISHSE